jgi:hypothetical protein
VRGVADSAILPSAVSVCAREVQTSPKSARLKFQLARALWTAKRYDEAVEGFIQAEEMDYAPAAYYLGLAYEQGLIEGQKADLAAAAELYMIAASEGFAPAVDAYQGIEWDWNVDFKAFAAPEYMKVVYEHDGSRGTLRADYRKNLMFYVIGIQNFLVARPGDYVEGCENLADPTVQEGLQRFLAREVPGGVFGGWMANAAYAGTDDAYALALDYGGCNGALFRRFYANAKTVVAEDGRPDTTLRPGAVESYNAADPETRRKMIEDWYSKAWPPPEDPERYVAAIDLGRPIAAVTLKRGQKLDYWMTEGSKAGGYFTYAGTDPQTLGLDLSNRVKRAFEVTGDLEVIEAVAARASSTDRNMSLGLGGPGGGKVLIIHSNLRINNLYPLP